MKTVIRKSLIISILCFTFSMIFSQELPKREFIKAVEDADLFYYYFDENDDNYESAARRYESILNNYPDNSNVAAKLGICYLNMDGKKAEALKLLKAASKNMVSTEEEYKDTGEKSPFDTELYLATAYHQNDSLETALALFYEVRKKLGNSDTYREEYVDIQIRNCRYGMEMKKKPLTIIPEYFTPWLKDYPGASNPVISKNDSVFVFTQKQEGKTKILCSYKTGGTWQEPTDITAQIGGYDRFYSNSITGDGKMLIIYMDDGGDGNLYYCQREGEVWSKIKNIGRPVNSIYWQSHGFITYDGKSFYFSSNRPGGKGELDIWVSERTEDGKWSEPVNCGDIINTPFNEDTPYFDPETGALLFSSTGHMSMGGYDLFRSVFRNGAWTYPTPIPFAFNTTLENTFFVLNNNGPGFITSYYDDKTESRNIFAIVAEDPALKITTAQGTIHLEDGMSVDPSEILIQLADIRKRIQKRNIPLLDSTSFKFDVTPGDYQLLIAHKGYKTDTININIPLYFPGSFIAVNSALTPDKVVSGEFLTIKNILFEFDSYALNDESISTLNAVKSFLATYPDLKIEVAGYTDSKGSSEYNKKLADRRAQAVIDYLSESGSQSRFTRKAYGKSNFATANTNLDGSDNPEGRKYNRRVTFGIVDPQTGITLTQETYTPEHLRSRASMKYSIVLIKTTEKLSASYFNSLKINEYKFIKTIETDQLTMYVLGIFYNKNDALKYLDFVKEKGFNDAYVVNQYELNNPEISHDVSVPEAEIPQTDKKLVYTVQLKAAVGQIDLKDFKGIYGVMEMVCNDGYYRYIFGEYNNFKKAQEALDPFLKSGYPDAFIRDKNLLIQSCESGKD